MQYTWSQINPNFSICKMIFLKVFPDAWKFNNSIEGHYLGNFGTEWHFFNLSLAFVVYFLDASISYVDEVMEVLDLFLSYDTVNTSYLRLICPLLVGYIAQLWVCVRIEL